MRNMRIIFYVFICLTFIFQGCAGQSGTKKKIFNKDFNWSITIPDNFDTVSAEQWAKIQNRGADAIEKTYDQKVENKSKTIFIFKSDQLNYFESNYQPFDTAVDGNYEASCNNVKEMLYQTFITQMQGVKVDTVTSTEKVDNLDFQTLKMNVTYPNNMVLNILMFSRLFDKREFSVNIMYVDKAKGELMLNAWKQSKFGGAKAVR